MDISYGHQSLRATISFPVYILGGQNIYAMAVYFDKLEEVFGYPFIMVRNKCNGKIFYLILKLLNFGNSISAALYSGRALHWSYYIKFPFRELLMDERNCNLFES